MKNLSFEEKPFCFSKSQKIVLKVTPLLLACIGSLLCYYKSFGESRDFQGYWQYMTSMESASNCLNEVSDSFEIGFHRSVCFLAPVFRSADTLIASFAFITLLTKLSILSSIISNKKICGVGSIKCLFLSVLMYFSRFYLIHESTQIRISLAIGFLFLTIVELLNLSQISLNQKKQIFESDNLLLKVSYTIRIFFATSAFFMACLFHSSCILTLPLFVAAFYSKSQKKIFFISILTFVLIKFLFVDYIIPVILTVNPRYSEYLYDPSIIRLNPLSSQRILDFILAYVGLKYFNPNNKYQVYFLTIWMLSIASFYALFDIPAMAFRFSEILQVFGILLVAVMRSKEQLRFTIPWVIATFFVSVYSFYTGSFFS